MKALVTGGAGFIGSRLVHALLDKKWSVRILDVRHGTLEKYKSTVEFVGVGSDSFHGGMADEDAVKKAIESVNVVYHLAINWNGAAWKHSFPLPDLFDINIRGTVNLLEAAKSEGVKHFLFASSTAVYGDSELEVVDEENVCKPELFSGEPGPAYGIMKFVTERLCLMYYREYGLPVTALRIGYVFEPPGNGEIHVKDVVQAFLLATLNEKAYGQVFNVSCDPSVSARKTKKILKWKPKFTVECRTP